jgi:hypothetical protein
VEAKPIKVLPMRIANPIYDVVFKYLMDDPKSAKLLLGEILQEEIVQLDFLPQESTFQIDEKAFKDLPSSIQDEIKQGGQLNVYLQRMDFTATIKTSKGEEKKVIIEIQKARYWAQIQRFRRYLGNAYLQQDADGKDRPIIAIYFLGDTLEAISAPVVRVENRLMDVLLGTELPLPKGEAFVDLLMHQGIIIQIPYLENAHRCKLEEFLAVFEQKRAVKGNRHFLEFDPETYPKEYRAVMRRLERAVCDSDLQRNMELEDEVQEVFATLDKKLEDERRDGLEKDNKIEKQSQVIEEKDQVIEEKDQALKEQSNTLKKQSEALEKKNRAITNYVLMLHRSGTNMEKIMQETGLSHDEIKTVMEQEKNP